MEAFMESFTGVIAVILIFGLPVIAVVMGIIAGMLKRKHEKEIRRLIIENHTDPETAKVLINAPKKQPRKVGSIDLDTLRSACILLGLGLGALINWLANISTGNLYFWLVIAFGIGVGLLAAFLVEIFLSKNIEEKKPE